jgi:hypothetical protein
MAESEIAPRRMYVNKNNFRHWFYRGEDTGFYLHLCYNVLAVNTDPVMFETASAIFKSEIGTGAFSFEPIDCSGDLSHIVVMKLRMARKGKALFRMGRGG